MLTERWLAVVGSGKWGSNHSRTAFSMGALAAVVDPAAEVRRDAAEKWDVPTFATLSDLVAAKSQSELLRGLVGVVIATPPATHAGLARDAMAAGLSVLVEKPMCPSVEEAVVLAECARAARHPGPGRAACKLMVGHLLRYGAPHSVAMELIKGGHVGKVRRVKALRINFGTVRVEENVLWSLCPHDVSVALAMCSADGRAALPRRVRCTGLNIVNGNNGVEDAVELTAEFESGALLHIEANWLHPEKERRMTVYGSEGFIVVNEAVPAPIAQLDEDATRNALPVRLWKYGTSVDKKRVALTKEEIGLVPNVHYLDASHGCSRFAESPLQSELEHFRNCCFDRTAEPLTDAEEGLRVVQVLAAATESMRERDGGWVSLKQNSLTPSTVVALPTARKVEASTSPYFAHESAIIDDGAQVGVGAKIWHFSHVMSGAVIGARCSLGQNVFVAGKVRLGVNVRVQNNVSLYDGLSVGDNVFLGPSCVFTNVRRPRSEFPTSASDYCQTKIGDGVTVGANAVIVCGVTVGDYAMIGAGCVVTKDVKRHAQVVGNPGRQVAWVGRTGVPLVSDADSVSFRSETSEETFMLVAGELVAEGR